MKRFLLFFFFILTAVFGRAQELSGRVTNGEEAIPYAAVVLKSESGQKGTSANAEGRFIFEQIAEGTYSVEVSAVGFQRKALDVTVTPSAPTQLDITLEEDLLELEAAVITGSRSPVPSYLSPVIVNRIDNRIFESTQSVSLAEGLSFSPGLRVETNCQNCGFTQLRMNGLEGAYSQVLINSRPVFSALAGVYGLEMIPPNMIERVEVVKGGGSVLYGGNAIAGTVNIITKDPTANSFEVGLNQALVNGEASDRTISFNGSVVSEDLQKGVSLYGFRRDREQWDANGDGFSELTAIENTTFGMNAFLNASSYSKLRLDLNAISEYRRGGNDFDLAPHQSDIAEELQHNILNAGFAYEQFSADYRHKFSVYGSAQFTHRDSYYGGGGRVLTAADSLTADDLLAINAYGQSEDLATVGGVQYGFTANESLVLTFGSEYQLNDVVDAMPGYERSIEQRVSTIGTYAQFEWDPTDRLCILGGGRFDYVDINGDYILGEEVFVNDRRLPVFVPRLSAMYDLTDAFKLRGSYAQGYRAPQAFDEDLHIETVGGAARFIRLDPDLDTERSESYTLSLNYSKRSGNLQSNIVIEAFTTRLENAFVLSDQQELASGVAVITKRNGDGATVQGLNLEGNFAYTEKWTLQLGATLQTARYHTPEVLWESEIPNEDTPAAIAENILRTPDAYGFANLTYSPTEAVALSYSGVYTGPMHVAHVIDPETEFTVIKRTPSFFEHNLRASYEWQADQAFALRFFAGVQNLTNSFQDDFDRGADRDAGYVYGPMRPRTFFGGIKLVLNGAP
jgi:outer membrane receptor for ferrienterochelin and colicins